MDWAPSSGDRSRQVLCDLTTTTAPEGNGFGRQPTRASAIIIEQFFWPGDTTLTAVGGIIGVLTKLRRWRPGGYDTGGADASSVAGDVNSLLLNCVNSYYATSVCFNEFLAVGRERGSQLRLTSVCFSVFPMLAPVVLP